jgi:hypothetical protein
MLKLQFSFNCKELRAACEDANEILAQYAPRIVAQITELTVRLEYGAEAFKQLHQARKRLTECLMKNFSITSVLCNAPSISAYTSLFTDSRICAQSSDFQISNEVLLQISKVSQTLLFSDLRKFLHLYLREYETFQTHYTFQYWLWENWKRHPQVTLLQKKKVAQLLSVDALSALARIQLINDLKFEQLESLFDLSSLRYSQFHSAITTQIYLEQLRLDDASEPPTQVKSLSSSEIFSMPFRSWLLGHEIIKIILQKSEDSETLIHESWVQLMIEIAGDPRSSSVSKAYRKWWARFSNAELNIAIRLMPILDLRAFLDALKDYADSQPAHSAARYMFPDRRRFLLGLLEQRVIISSKVFFCAKRVRVYEENRR